MPTNNYRDLTVDELMEQEKSLKAELFNLRFQMASGQLSNPMVLRECRRNIARVKTIMREAQLKQA